MLLQHSVQQCPGARKDVVLKRPALVASGPGAAPPVFPSADSLCTFPGALPCCFLGLTPSALFLPTVQHKETA